MDAKVTYLLISLVEHFSISSCLFLLHILTVQLLELLRGDKDNPGGGGCVGVVHGSGESLRSSSSSESRSSISTVVCIGAVH